MIEQNLYETLGVNPDATTKQIKSAYRKLAAEHHPDGDGDPDMFKQVEFAHSILSNPEKRERYDSTGNVDEEDKFDCLAVIVSLVPDAFSQKRIDPFEWMRIQLDNRRNQTISRLKQVRGSISDLKKQIDDIKKHNDENDIVVEMVISRLQDSINKGDAAIQMVNDEILGMLETKKLIEDLKCPKESNPFTAMGLTPSFRGPSRWS